jgi:uncharacterized metal-binding protein
MEQQKSPGPEKEIGKTRIIFPCAGQANVGQLTNLAALRLTEEGYGNIACVSLLAIGTESLVANAMNAGEVVILDGCPMLCAKKIAGAQGVEAGQHLVVTGLGIAKGPSMSYTTADVDTIVAACRNGEGRQTGTAKPGKKDNGMHCGCGCNGTS